MIDHMRAILIVMLGMIILSAMGCGKPFQESEYTDIGLHIRWVEEHEVFGIAQSLGHTSNPLNFNITAVTAWQDDNGERNCFIYAPKPYSDKDYHGLYILGHEVAHCSEGNFH